MTREVAGRWRGQPWEVTGGLHCAKRGKEVGFAVAKGAAELWDIGFGGKEGFKCTAKVVELFGNCFIG